jgi:hypothetical protein
MAGTIEPADLRAARAVAKEAPVEGTTRSFWRWDFSVMPPAFKKIDSTCRAAGDHAYVFVEDASWGKKVKDEDIRGLLTVFEKSTPPSSIAPDKGICSIDRQVFGDLPDALDKDPKVYLFVTDLGNYNGMGFDGYFNAFDQLPDKVAWEKYRQHSNEVEILYLNCGSNETPIGSDYMKSVTSHELQHMIHFNYDAQEESWLNESCSEAAMTATGFFTDAKHLARYAANPASPLIVKDFVDYGACLLWGTYLLEQLGPDFYPALVANPLKGDASITDTLDKLHRPENFRRLFDQWIAANFAASRGVSDPRYCYRSFPVPPMRTSALMGAFPAERTAVLKSSGIDYLALKAPGGKKLKLTLNVSPPRTNRDGDYTVQVLHFDGKEISVEKLDFSKKKSSIITCTGDDVIALAGLGGKDFGYNLKVEEA